MHLDIKAALPFLKRALPPILLTLVLMLTPSPEGLPHFAWIYFGLFCGIILALILEPLPAPLIGLIGVTIGALFSLPFEGHEVKSSVSWALSGFSNTTVWLIFVACIFSLGYQKSGLGKRISLYLVSRLGRSSLGLGYAISLADLALSPFIPSNTARSGGTIFPIAMSIPPIYKSHPDQNPKGMGQFIVWVALASTCVTSSMFATSLAPAVLGLSLLDSFGIHITWIEYFIVAAPMAIPLFILTPLLAWWMFKPTAQTGSAVTVWADDELKRLGKVSTKELGMLFSAALALVLWIFGKLLGVHGTVAALIAVFSMFALRVITWEDFIGHKGAFSVLVWFATLVALAKGLKSTGFLDWVASDFSPYLQSGSVMMTLSLVAVGYFVIHYLFASTTAHVSALLPVIMALLMPVLPEQYHVALGLVLVLSLGLMGIITPFATGPAPIWYGAGYIPSGKWWLAGFVFGLLYLVAFVAIDIPWIVYYTT